MFMVTCLRRAIRHRMRQAAGITLGEALTDRVHARSHAAGRDPGRRRAGLLAPGLAAIALLAAACGGGSSDSHGVANAGSPSPSSSASASTLAFARCMRAHGVTDFPDSGGLGQSSPGSDLDPSNPTYKAAWQACQSLRPVASPNPAQAAQALIEGLKFSKCMRSHGVTKFPDPNPHGGPHGHGGIDLRGLGIDTNSPQFHTAQQACQHYLGANGKGRE